MTLSNHPHHQPISQNKMEKLYNAIRIRKDELFKDIKKAAIDENYRTMEEYIEMIHINRKIFNKVKNELRKPAK